MSYSYKIKILLVTMSIAFAVIICVFYSVSFQDILILNDNNTDIPKRIIDDDFSHSVNLVYRKKDGKTIKVIANLEEYDNFIKSRVAKINDKYSEINNIISNEVSNELNNVFDLVYSNVPVFSDWYFSYSNQYDILVNSIICFLYNINDENVLNKVRNKHIEMLSINYNDRVIKPQITNIKLNKLFKKYERYVSEKWLDIGAELDDDMQTFMAKYTEFIVDNKDYPEVVIEWQSMAPIYKMAPEVSVALGGVRGIPLAIAGGMAGKVLGQELTNLLVTRMTTQAAALALTGVSVGGLGGMIGIAVGVTASLGLDWLVIKGIEADARPQFEVDITDAIKATKDEISDVIASNLRKYNEKHFHEYMKTTEK